MGQRKLLVGTDKSPSFLGPLGEPKKAYFGGVDSSRLRGFHIWSRSKRVPPILSSFLDQVRVSASCGCYVRVARTQPTYNNEAIIYTENTQVLCAVRQKREQECVRSRRL